MSGHLEPRRRLGASLRPFDRSDFAGFYQETAERIYRLGWLLAGEEGEDLAAEAFAKAFARWSDVGDMANPEAWVRKVLVNLSISWKRRLASRREGSARLQRDRPSLYRSTDAMDDRMTVAQSVSRLPPKQRAAVILRHYEGRTLKDIARILGCRISSVNSHLRRAHDKLAQELGPEYRGT